jgi:hypothetical protein
MAYFVVEGNRTSCTAIVGEFLFKFIYNKIPGLKWCWILFLDFSFPYPLLLKRECHVMKRNYTIILSLLICTTAFSNVRIGVDIAGFFDIAALLSGDTEMVFHAENDIYYGFHAELTFGNFGIGFLWLMTNYPAYDALGNPTFTFIVLDIGLFVSYHILGDSSPVDPFVEMGIGTMQWLHGRGQGFFTEEPATLLSTDIHGCTSAGIALNFFNISAGLKCIIHPFTFNPRPDLPQYQLEFLKIVIFLGYTF